MGEEKENVEKDRLKHRRISTFSFFPVGKYQIRWGLINQDLHHAA